MAKLAEAEVARVLADREAPARIEADLARVESKEARLVDLLAEGDLAADAVEAKLGARGPASTLIGPCRAGTASIAMRGTRPMTRAAIYARMSTDKEVQR